MYNKIKEKVKIYLKEIWQDKNKRITVLLYFILPFFINIVVETLNRRSFIECLKFMITSFDVFFINMMIIMAILSITLLLRKRIPALILLSIVWIGMGIANFIIKSNRETPFSYSDMQDLKSVIDVFDKYMSDLQLIFLVIIILAVFAGIIFIWYKAPKYDKKINYIRSGIYIAVVWLVMILSANIGQALDRVSVKFPNMTIAYLDYGFSYCFSYSFISVGVEKPETYNNEDIKSIAEKIESVTTVDADNVETPNIIFLQLESFIDLTNVTDIQLNTPATPNFTSLKQEYTSGYLTVNNVGYGTANTEFEIMTGMNLEDFGVGEFPYKTILKTETCESLSYILREYGYTSHAIHNNTGSFYSRNQVFKNLGYDTYTSVEYMNPEEFTPLGWVKDSILTDEIMKTLESTEEQDYVYAISVQGHGSYPSYEVLEEPYIQITGGIDDEEKLNQFTYYANQIHEMDLFIGELINELSNYDEEVILVMYGDHLPSLGLTEEDLINKNLYQTEYVIWSNYGYSLENKDIETYQLGSRILQSLNMDEGIINKFHQVYQNEDDYLSALKKLEYDILYGDRYVFGGSNPYVATDMQMGTYPIEITSVMPEDINNPIPRPADDDEEDNESLIDKITGDDEGTDADTETVEPGYIVVKGNNFTSYSHVFVNDEKCDTIYIDESTLLAYVPELKSLDVVVVKQMWKSKTVISTTDEYMYITVEQEENSEDTENI
ncbi:MAG: LTA synthase family protein [Lachnospiraceae bacterium]